MATNRYRREDNASAQPVRRRASVRGSIGLAAMLIVGLPSFASAQQYQTKPIDDKARMLGPIAQNCVRAPARYATDKDKFDEYFQKYFFPAMTRYEPNDLAELGKMREELVSRYLWASSDTNLQSDLTKLAFAELQPVERSSKYHPAVRYNAILILGMLDQTYAGAGRAPVPLKEATAELTLIVDYAANGKPVPPYLVVGALVGMQRHALYHDSLDRATVEAMSAAAQKLAGKEVSLSEIDTKVAEWIRIQAATVLANLGSPGPKGEVLAVLANMIVGQTTPKMSLDARCQVAALLKQMKVSGANVDGKIMSDALLQLAVDVGDDEAKEAKAFEDTQMQGGGFGGYGAISRSKGRMRLDAETSMWEYDARILLARLTDLRTGLSNFKAHAPADKQPVFDTVIAAIDLVLKSAGSSDAVDLNVADEVRKMGKQIRTAVLPGTEVPEEAAPAELF
jgi:hypothetical protein